MRFFKPFLLSAVCLLSVAQASTRDAGIYADDGSVIQPPGAQAFMSPTTPVGLPVSDPNRRDTNAERLRLGLPLLPPKRRLDSSKSPQPEVEELVEYNPAARACIDASRGIIEVRRGGVLLGYMRKNYLAQNSFTYGPLDQALIVAGPNITGGPAVDLIALNGPDVSFPRVGLVGGASGFNFNTGQIGYAYFSGTGKTNLNSVPSYTVGHSINILGYNGPAESQVWGVACDGTLTVQWTNVDGSQPPARLIYDQTVNFLGAIGDLDRFVSAFPDESVFVVTFRFIPTPA